MLCLFGVTLLNYNILSRLEKMLNRAIRMVYGLRKFDHVSTLQRKLGCLPFQFLIQYHCLLVLYHHYHSDEKNTILLSPPLQFGRQSKLTLELLLILLFHTGSDCHLLKGFSNQKGLIGGTTCHHSYWNRQMAITVLRDTFYFTFWTMIASNL